MNKNTAINKWEEFQNKSFINKWRSLGRGQNLSYLNELSNGIHGQLLIHLFTKYIYKLKPGLVSKKKYLSNGQFSIIESFKYGHIEVDNKVIRLSTCLDIKNNIVTYPIEEQQYLEYGDYIFFTCGDLYLLVNTHKLNISIHHRKTEKKNYELNITSLFELDAVEKFGFIDFSTSTFEDEGGLVHQITEDLPEGYLKANLRGCLIGKKPHYILAKLENSGSKTHFEYELWTNYKDIYFEYKATHGIKTWQAIGLQARKNTEKVFNEDKWMFTNLVGKSPGVIKADQKAHYMIFDYQIVNDLEIIRKYCNKIYRKYYANRV